MKKKERKEQPERIKEYNVIIKRIEEKKKK
jgi:hypothetical protein